MRTKWSDQTSQLTRLMDAETIASRLQEMLNEGFCIDEPLAEMQNAPPLILVVLGEKGRNLVLTEMLRLGANPNVPQVDTGVTPLMFASSTGDTTIPQTLIEAGADTEMQDDTGQTALHYAAGNLLPETVELLLRHGANRFHRDHANRSAADTARASGIAFMGQAPLTLGWSLRDQELSDAATAARVDRVIALLEDTKAAQ